MPLGHCRASPAWHSLLPTPQGVNVTALREVKLLRELRSPYLVRLLEVLPQKRGINLVRRLLLPPAPSCGAASPLLACAQC